MPEQYALVGLFYDQPEALGQFVEITADDMPLIDRALLAHDRHMTVTVEAYHGCPVELEVLAARIAGDVYVRQILLRRASDQRVVMLGIVRLRLHFLDDEVRREIQQQQTPLGHILIGHDVMREVQLAQLWQLVPGAELRQLFGLETPVTTYGRTALIYCNGEPAIELLEIVTPS